jgi:hypothetical protein
VALKTQPQRRIKKQGGSTTVPHAGWPPNSSTKQCDPKHLLDWSRRGVGLGAGVVGGGQRQWRWRDPGNRPPWAAGCSAVTSRTARGLYQWPPSLVPLSLQLLPFIFAFCLEAAQFVTPTRSSFQPCLFTKPAWGRERGGKTIGHWTVNPVLFCCRYSKIEASQFNFEVTFYSAVKDLIKARCWRILVSSSCRWRSLSFLSTYKQISSLLLGNNFVVELSKSWRKLALLYEKIYILTAGIHHFFLSVHGATVYYTSGPFGRCWLDLIIALSAKEIYPNVHVFCPDLFIESQRSRLVYRLFPVSC